MKDKLKFNTIGMIESVIRHAEKNDTDREVNEWLNRTGHFDFRN